MNFILIYIDLYSYIYIYLSIYLYIYIYIFTIFSIRDFMNLYLGVEFSYI